MIFSENLQPEKPKSEDITKDLRLSEYEGTFYYISSSLGDDLNDGLSEDTPWQSFENLYEIDLEAGDRVLLRRGDVWHERLTVRGSGSEDAWIFVGAYGDVADAKPEISLENKKDDIAILATDISVGGKNGFGLNYIWIDNIKVSNSLLGIYFRYDSSTDNEGIRVTNCSFSNINCPEVMEEALTNVDFLMSQKGDLEDRVGNKVVENGGGAAEYIWPTAINIGGRPPLPLSGVTVEGVAEPATVVSGIELYQNEFDGCIVAVGANCYNYHYGTGPDQCYTYTVNWNIRGITATNTMTVLNIDSADFGYDGTDASEWGRWSNIQAKSGMSDYTMSAGTTQALFSCCKNLYISNSSFNDCHNNGRPDGCGFDFERSVHNFTLDSCIFANNQGQGVLVMQTTCTNQVTGETVNTPNTNNTVKNCLFYNNMRSVLNENYCYDITVFNADNENFVIEGNYFYFRETTEGGATVTINPLLYDVNNPYGPCFDGIVSSRNKMTCRNSLPPLEDLIEKLDMTDSVGELLPQNKTWYNYTDEGAQIPETETETAPTESETDTETVTEPKSETVALPESETEKELGSSETDSAETDVPDSETDNAVGGCGSSISCPVVLAAASAAVAVAVSNKKRKK